ncbi:GDSL esterase/lipase [Halotydeus destructor]|nr:GDSL esterase/lipase [Halotydeus destructor]
MPWPKVVLLGDSLVEFSLSPDGQWAALLGDRLKRVADVVVRGLAGYNSRWLLLALPKLFPESESLHDVSCLVILIGANDSNPQECPFGLGVPIDEYKVNLKAIVDFFVGRGLTKDKIILLTPPPFYKEEFNAWFMAEAPQVLKDGGLMIRSDENAHQYAQACVQVGDGLQLTTVNLYDPLKADPRGSGLFADGLHFSAQGSKLVFDSVFPAIESRVLKHTGTTELTMQLPEFFAVNRADPSLSF